MVERLPFSKIDQVGIVVKDMEKAIEYYQSLGIGLDCTPMGGQIGLGGSG